MDHQHVMIDNLKDGLSLSDDEGDSVYTTESGVTPVFSRSRNPAHAPVHSSASGVSRCNGGRCKQQGENVLLQSEYAHATRLI